jgi:hypothetical protein
MLVPGKIDKYFFYSRKLIYFFYLGLAQTASESQYLDKYRFWHTLSILFSGQMIDNAGRPAPRFPASKAAAAGVAIRQALGKIIGTGGLAETAGPAGFRGIAAAACGGDILLHEACLDLHIPSELYLGLPVDEFDKTSVAFAGKNSQERYRRLTNLLPVHILFRRGNRRCRRADQGKGQRLDAGRGA